MSSIHDARYQKLILNLIQIRESKDVTQVELSIILKKPQSYIAKVENLDRRIDVIEGGDWLGALNSSLSQLLDNTDLRI